MSSELKGVQWECEWIDRNPQYYRDKEHMLAVKLNINRNTLARKLDAIAAAEGRAKKV